MGVVHGERVPRDGCGERNFSSDGSSGRLNSRLTDGDVAGAQQLHEKDFPVISLRRVDLRVVRRKGGLLVGASEFRPTRR